MRHICKHLLVARQVEHRIGQYPVHVIDAVALLVGPQLVQHIPAAHMHITTSVDLQGVWHAPASLVRFTCSLSAGSSSRQEEGVDKCC